MDYQRDSKLGFRFEVGEIFNLGLLLMDQEMNWLAGEPNY